MSDRSELVETSLKVMALIERAREEGIDDEEYNRMMEKGLTSEQVSVVEEYSGEGRVQLTGVRSPDDRDANVPRLIDKLAEGKKIPWTFEIDGVGFVVKAKYGEGRNSHTAWTWQEDGFRFTFYNPKRDDCVHSVNIREVEN